MFFEIFFVLRTEKMKRELALLVEEAHVFGRELNSDRSRRRTIYNVGNVSSIRIGKNHQAKIEEASEKDAKDRGDQIVLDPVLSHQSEYVDKYVMLSCLKD